MIILMEALKGGMAELRDCPDLPSRLSTAARHARLIAEELSGQVVLIPFALRALSERRRAKKEGRLVEGVRYGPRERQIADLWLPTTSEKEEEEKRRPAIVVLFHGGTWTAGDKWHVGPAASRLSTKCRCVVVAPNYSVYSSREGLGISASVEDAVDAVRWAGTAAAMEAGGADEAAAAKRSSPSPSSPPPFSPPPSSSHGGDPSRLAVLGHSAGAHLAVSSALVLAAERGEEEERDGKRSKKKEPKTKKYSLPSLVVSLAGPFDLPSHFEHEGKRGVHRLSTMARAAATPGSFALEASCKNGGGGAAEEEEEGGREKKKLLPFFDAAPELHRASLVALSPLACLDPGASLAGMRSAAGPLAGVAAAAAAAAARRRGGEEKEKNTKTRFLFLSSAEDAVVPSSSSTALCSALARPGHSVRHVEYCSSTATREEATEAAAAAGENGSREQIKVRLAAPVGHADFVVCGWGKSQSGPLAPWAAEVEAVVSSL